MNRKDDHAELDALLKSESQQTIRKVIKDLPEDSLSLSWRSDLNEKLRQARPTPRWRFQLAAAWRPAVALTLTGCLAMLITLRLTPNATAEAPGLENSLVTVYYETANFEEVSGSGLALHEINDTTEVSEPSAESDLDFGNL